MTGVGVFIVETAADGLTLTPQTTTTGRPEAIVELAGVHVGADRLLGEGADGAEVITAITEFATTALCVEEAGVCAAALELTAEYTKTRVQFDKPIATFQAVGQRAADAYVDTEAIRLTAWQAASRLASGLPAASEVAVAKYWAAEGGQRVVHAASHLHGGVGVDRDYPLHRYFLLDARRSSSRWVAPTRACAGSGGCWPTTRSDFSAGPTETAFDSPSPYPARNTPASSWRGYAPARRWKAGEWSGCVRCATSWTSTESSTHPGTARSRCETRISPEWYEHEPQRAVWFVTQRTDAGRAPTR